jgi:putative hydroxymethylpyrimidine transport system permease protein
MTILKNFISRWWAIVALLAAWQLAVLVFRINPFLIPGPANIASEVAKDPASYLLPLLSTMRTALIGFVVGVSTGYLAASLAWMWSLLGTMLTPLALVIRSVPFVALIPVLARIFGYSEVTAWIICSMVCFFPTFVLVGTGLRDVPANGNDVFSAAGSSRFDRYRLLAAPASFVNLATSIRIVASVSLAAAMIAEFLMGTPGLAFVLSNSLATLNMTKVWAASAVVIVFSVLAYLAASHLERTVLTRWR